MKIAFALGLMLVFALAYESAQFLRRRSGAEVDAPWWSRALTIAIVALTFATRLPFTAALGLTCCSIVLSQSFVWRATGRAAERSSRPRLLWAAAALESTGFAVVLGLGLLARG